MKRRVAPILTFTIALIFLWCLTFAEEKKDLPKAQDQTSDATHEEEALKTELLEAVGNPDNKLGDVSTKKVIPAAEDENTKDLITKQPKK
jgi:hypothetical protein